MKNPKRRVRKPKPKKRYVLGRGKMRINRSYIGLHDNQDQYVWFDDYFFLEGQRVTLVAEVE